MVNRDASADVRALLASPRAAALVAEGALIGTRFLEGKDLERWRKETGSSDAVLLEHEPVHFANYPFEWPAEMLHAAAALTLRLARGLLHDGIELKDATPYNILFRGTRPVFVDMLSFERHDSRSSSWRPFAQYVRAFLLPLLLNKRFGFDLSRVFLTARDGIEPEEAARMFGMLSRVQPLVLKHVVLPTLLGGRAERDRERLYVPRTDRNAEKAAFVFDALLKGLERDTERVRPDARRTSEWSEYIPPEREKSDPYIRIKSDVLQSALQRIRPARVLDIGANTGMFSLMAAAAGAEVIAIDRDAVAAGRLWKRAHEAKLGVLPLAVDIARPTPAVGWQNRETSSFLDRARNHRFDLVVMLGIVHHLCITERIPISGVMELAASLTTDHLIIEFVAFDDPMFRRLLRGREALHSDWNIEAFEAASARHFTIVEKQVTAGTRHIYAMRKRT